MERKINVEKKNRRGTPPLALLLPLYGMHTSSLAAVEMRSGGRALNLSLDGRGRS
jgi:hypothetical protein